jgi:16S rRNA G966 N2-methylase RsmD
VPTRGKRRIRSLRSTPQRSGFAQKATVGLAKGRAGPGRGKAGATAGPAFTEAPTLAEAGVDKKLSSRAQKFAAIAEPHFETLLNDWRARIAVENARVAMDLVKAGEKEAARAAKEQRKTAVPADLPAITDRYRLIHADIEAADIPVESVDCIVTDPPYPQEFIGCYTTLARKAAEWLKPGGSLLAMAGQTHLPDVLAALAVDGLSYQWTVAYLTPGGQSVQIFPRHVNTFWKPVFWFVKGDYVGDWIGDVSRSDPNDNDKRFHHWGQSESGFADLIERFTYPGDVICDPFMGAGTTGVVAVRMNRFFVGIDQDEKAYATARERLGGLT